MQLFVYCIGEDIPARVGKTCNSILKKLHESGADIKDLQYVGLGDYVSVMIQYIANEEIKID